MKALHGRLRSAFQAARFSSSQEAARHKRLYDRKAGVVEFRPGDKVLVRLDSYKGANRKLINRWSSTLHTVVGRIVDDVPAYVIENDKGKQQVLHRDVKPANILLTSQAQARLADFGTGMFMSERTKERVGTAFYMAPEIFEGKGPSVQGDIYSLGVLAYEVLSGDRPFEGNSYDELMLQHLTSVPVNLRFKRRDVTTEISQVIAKAMSRDQDKRFTTVREFIDAFENETIGPQEVQPEVGRFAMSPPKFSDPTPAHFMHDRTLPRPDGVRDEALRVGLAAVETSWLSDSLHRSTNGPHRTGYDYEDYGFSAKATALVSVPPRPRVVSSNSLVTP